MPRYNRNPFPDLERHYRDLYRPPRPWYRSHHTWRAAAQFLGVSGYVGAGAYAGNAAANKITNYYKSSKGM